MSLELNLRFTNAENVEVKLGEEDSGTLPFSNPLTPKDHADLRWYLETYGAYSLGDPDDKQARDVKSRLPLIGKALFDAVFSNRAAQRLFDRFQDADDKDRQLSIAGEQAEVLSLPWELLHDSAKGGAFLFRERPAVSIRRRLAGATGGRKPFKVETKDTLRLLFVVSRPEGAGFLDPRADPGAVMDALEAEAPGRVVCEFLRPATIDALTARLDDDSLPPVDIVHFDGHGVFDADGRIEDPHRKSGDREDVRDRTREAANGENSEDEDSDKAAPTGMGYLLFEDPDGQRHLVSAEEVGLNLHRSQVSLVILSACQSAMVGDTADPLAMVAARLTAAGIPAVLAMTHSVLVHTTRTLFGEFYRHLARGGRIGESLDRARAFLQNHPQKYDVQRGPIRQKLELHDWFVPALYQSGHDVPLLHKYDVPPLTGDRRPTVFLSHSSLDKPAARRLADSLTMHGIDVWIDEGEITVGAPISQTISDALKDCDYLVALLSQNSVESEWVKREICSRLHSDAANARHSILPVQLDDCEIPPLLTDLLRADLRENHTAAVSSLVKAIRQTRRLEQATRRSGNTPDDAPDPTQSPAAALGRLRPTHEAGFFGRRRELWDIECWFAGKTERISITGFGGQGKTELALEAGRWLTRTGQFQQAVFVDYSRIQADAPESVVRVALSHIGSVLDRSLTDVQEATSALRDSPTLVILDNLEVLSPESLQTLLDAAVLWSRAGGSRVLLTSRTPEFDHPDFATAGTFKHRRITLTGLGDKSRPDDALEWFAELSKLPPAPDSGIEPPTRDELIELFDQVRFHPLSIAVLAQQLKSRKASELGQRLEQLLSNRRLEQAPRSSGIKAEPLPEQRFARSSLQVGDDTPLSLLASLLLSLDLLTDDERQAVRALGVFQGGAMEADLLAITGFDENDWPELRRQLERAALIEAERVPGVGPPFLRFHPTLAPLLWSQLDAAEQSRLTDAHHQRYYQLAGYLYHKDATDPHHARAIAWRELPNLLHAVHNALAAATPDAVEFATKVTSILTDFSLKREAETLTGRAEAIASDTGSQDWFLAQSNRGDRLLASGQVAAAAEVFTTILDTLGDRTSYERAVTLLRLGRCYKAGGRPDLAEASHREGIAVTEQLEPSDGVKRHRGFLHTDLADVLSDQGRYPEAREQYEAGLAIDEELNDLRGQGVTLGQLATLAMREGNLAEAQTRYRDALTLFQRLREPTSEAVIWHQLGVVFQKARNWDEAERHYRESARFKEADGNVVGAARTWNNLAALNENANRIESAETWYRKAIQGFQAVGETVAASSCFYNLACLLRSQPHRLAEARKLVEEALAIKQTLDPGAAEIWKAYTILAEIADQQSRGDEAAEYRRLARDAKRNFAGTRHELRRHLTVIIGTIVAVQDASQLEEFEATLTGLEQRGWTNLVVSIRNILTGQRDADTLCTSLDLQDSMIIETILAGLADPSTLSDLLPPDAAPED
ncbi:MAG: tetratricopeptide repeat protein [Rhodopirellula sp.]|nr:tetratricopeptide repeat protein [Rhodopirellula sp.]